MIVNPPSNGSNIPETTLTQQSVPHYARIHAVNFQGTSQAGTFMLKMQGTVNVIESQLMVFCHMSDGTVITAFLGNVSVPNFCSSGQSVLTDASDNIIGTGSVTYTNDQITIQLTGDYSNRSCIAVSTSYAPPATVIESMLSDFAGFDLPRGSIGKGIASSHIIDPGLVRVDIYWPNIARAIADGLNQGGYNGPVNVPGSAVGNPFIHSSGSHRLLPRTDDVNGDGISDFDYAGGMFKIPGTNVIIDARGVDRNTGDPSDDQIAYIYGRDLNGDGVLQSNEIIGMYAICVFVPGLNAREYFVSNGVLYIVHRNWNPQTGEGRYYTLNTQTNYLIIRDQNGNTLWQGPISDFQGLVEANV